MALSPVFVRQVAHRGTKGNERHTDGYGLMLDVKPSGSKSWVQRVRVKGQRIIFSLGPWPVVSLAEARELALQNYAKARRGEDPRDKERQQRSSAPTFRDAAATVIDIQSAAWKPGSKSRGQWESSLATYVFPVFGDKTVDAITSADVMRVIEPIWGAKRVTASRVRERIGAVMKWAVAQGLRPDNPAGDAILQALPKGRGELKKHHRALPYAEVADALRQVRESDAGLSTKLAFEWLVLTACRSGEVRGATWEEIDGDTWTVPAERMKAKKEHRVPLPPRCLEILDECRQFGSELLFPTPRGRKLDGGHLSEFIRELGIPAVPHGFRSTFRDWAAETTDAPHAVMEAALAHTIPNSAERAYARSDLFERRRGLMERWAAHVCSDSGELLVAANVGVVAAANEV